MAVPGCATCTDPLSYQQRERRLRLHPRHHLSGGACVPVTGTCGTETYTGRCVGDLLIYCDDVSSPIQIETIDCAQNPNATTCAFGDNGYDCRVPASSCGAVPDTGACVGTTPSTATPARSRR